MLLPTSNQGNMLVSFLDFFVFLEFFRVFLLIEEPRISFHILIYWSRHTSRIDIWMSFWIDQRVFWFDVFDCGTIHQIGGEDETSNDKYQV